MQSFVAKFTKLCTSLYNKLKSLCIEGCGISNIVFAML